MTEEANGAEYREREIFEQMQAIREPTFAVRAGFWLLCGMLALVGLLVVGVGAYLAVVLPSPESFGTPPTAESLARWDQASTAVFGRVTGLMDQMVGKVLLPVVTLLLGYVFGTRADQ
jgi:hypothetical protein